MYNEENREFNINPKKEETPEGMTNENTASENTAEFTEHNENINNTEANETEKEGTKLSEEGVSKTAESEFKECNEEENKTAERKPYEPIKDCYYKETVKKPKKNGFKRLIAACAVVGLCGGIGIGSGYSVMENIVFRFLFPLLRYHKSKDAPPKSGLLLLVSKKVWAKQDYHVVLLSYYQAYYEIITRQD